MATNYYWSSKTMPNNCIIQLWPNGFSASSLSHSVTASSPKEALERLLSKTKALPNLLASGYDLSGVDFRGCDISNSKFEACNMRNCDFRDCDLLSTYFPLCVLDHTDFRGAIVRDTFIRKLELDWPLAKHISLIDGNQLLLRF